MGAVRTKLESYKRPAKADVKGGKVGKHHVNPPKGGSAPKNDLKSLFWMGRALQKDQASALQSQVLADASTVRRQGSLNNAASIGSALDKLLLDADNALQGLD